MNSRRKGKDGELEAAAFLRGLGFTAARRTQQFSGAGHRGDVEDTENLPLIHFEVKRGKNNGDWHHGSRHLLAACEQAARDANGSYWVVLWRVDKGHWHLTFLLGGELVTASGDKAIGNMLRYLHNNLKPNDKAA